MKRKILTALSAVVIFIVGILIVASFQPKEFHVERTVSTSAQAQDIYNIMGNFGRFSEWSPWHKLDPNMKVEMSGQPGEVGSSYSWEGNDDVGSGKMTIAAVQPPQSIDVDLEFFKPFPGKSKVIWRIEDTGSERKMTWSMDGTNDNIIARAMCMFFSMDKMIGRDFEEGLSNLKNVVERGGQ